MEPLSSLGRPNCRTGFDVGAWEKTVKAFFQLEMGFNTGICAGHVFGFRMQTHESAEMYITVTN